MEAVHDSIVLCSKEKAFKSNLESSFGFSEVELESPELLFKGLSLVLTQREWI